MRNLFGPSGLENFEDRQELVEANALFDVELHPGLQSRDSLHNCPLRYSVFSFMLATNERVSSPVPAMLDHVPAAHLCKLINFKVEVALTSQVPAGPTGILRFTLKEPVPSPRDWRKASKR